MRITILVLLGVFILVYSYINRQREGMRDRVPNATHGLESELYGTWTAKPTDVFDSRPKLRADPSSRLTKAPPEEGGKMTLDPEGQYSGEVATSLARLREARAIRGELPYDRWSPTGENEGGFFGDSIPFEEKLNSSHSNVFGTRDEFGNRIEGKPDRLFTPSKLTPEERIAFTTRAQAYSEQAFRDENLVGVDGFRQAMLDYVNDPTLCRNCISDYVPLDERDGPIPEPGTYTGGGAWEPLTVEEQQAQLDRLNEIEDGDLPPLPDQVGGAVNTGISSGIGGYDNVPGPGSGSFEGE